jgi:hypothetical protein
MADTFVLISPMGHFAVSYCSKSGFDHDRSHNDINETMNLSEATVFNKIDRRNVAYQTAAQKGFVEVPAFVIRRVIIGEEKV